MSFNVSNTQNTKAAEIPIFKDRLGIGKYKVGAHWKDLPAIIKIRDVFKSVFKVLTTASAAGAITFFVTPPPLSLFLVPTVMLVVFVAGMYLVGKSIFNLYKIKDTAHITPSTTTPKLGEWTANKVHITQNSSDSMKMKFELIKSAQRSIEISGSYCGGKIFDEALDLIEKKLRENPKLTVKIISNKDLLNSSNYKNIKRLARNYPDRFFLLETKKQFIFFPTLRTEENHTKLLIVDESVCMTGGSGIQDMLSREGPDANTQLSKKEQLIGQGARDMDVAIEGPLAKTMRYQFYQLLSKWKDKTPEKRKYGKLNNYDYSPIEVERPSVLPSKISTNATMIASSYEHGTSNESKLAYLQMIQNAKRTIVLANMCLNQPEILEALRQASLRGVKIDIITNTNNNRSPMCMKIMGIANRLALTKLKEKNISFYEYYKNSTLYHKKVMIVDSKITTIGSFNISLHCADTEDEDLVIFDSPKVAERVLSTLKEDIKNSQLVSHFNYLGVIGRIRKMIDQVKSRFVLAFTAHVFQ